MYLLKLPEKAETLDDLKLMLQQALGLELTVIAPYLTALYTIKDPASPAATIIQSIVVEEMLHMAMDFNLINAIGGKGDLVDVAEKFKNLPEPLPYKDADGAIVSLQKCSIEQVKSLFCRIELPSEKWKDHRPFPAQPKDFVTLGQFYEAIWQVFDKLGEDIVLPDTVQYGLPIYQTGGGRLWEVDSLQKALDLITQNQLQTASNDISHEEPWGPNGMKEKAHYYKFLDIANGIIPIGDTYNMLPNCKPADIKEELPSDLNLLFDYGFSIIVDSIEQLYGKQADINCFFGMAMTAMNKIMKPLAYLMMQIPIDNNGYQDFVAGPSFIYYHIRNPDDEQGNQPYIKATRLARKLLDGNHYPCGTPEFKMLTTAYDGFQTITPYLLDYE